MKPQITEKGQILCPSTRNDKKKDLGKGRPASLTSALEKITEELPMISISRHMNGAKV